MSLPIKEDEELTIDEYMASVGADMLHAGGTKRTDDLVEMCGISYAMVKVLSIGNYHSV